MITQEEKLSWSNYTHNPTGYFLNLSQILVNLKEVYLVNLHESIEGDIEASIAILSAHIRKELEEKTK